MECNTFVFECSNCNKSYKIEVNNLESKPTPKKKVKKTKKDDDKDEEDNYDPFYDHVLNPFSLKLN